MFDHIGLRVRDLAASRRFYAAVLAPLGHVAAEGDGFGPPGAPGLWLHESGEAGRGAHLAFRAASHAAVAAFHAAGLAVGGRDNGAPGPRPDYGPRYYAAFLIDPEGNNVEAVCLAEIG
ncbi:VOC family protein [Belnapia sp. T6]|uniref:VOC family protein n=1 Tax=Belnapia mucosa TaxID=2804532 RepID=A0ABS1V7M0_9PROT|nr:VOC family protein [Belnapia mucosa]MBL6457667.1 VOC family protein [Belnapia mucosa]